MTAPNSKWIVVGGGLLAFLAAAVNACFLIEAGTSVSHLTGDVSKVAMNLLEDGAEVRLALLKLIVASAGFVAGAAGAGFTIHHPEMEFSRPYGRSVTGIGLGLAAAYFCMPASPILSIGLAGAACGFQNALATHYRGMILRTTHVTGLLTDFGAGLGMRLRGHRLAWWRLLVPAVLVGSFFAGAFAGAVMVAFFKGLALLLLAVIYVCAGITWSVWKRRGRNSGEEV